MRVQVFILLPFLRTFSFCSLRSHAPWTVFRWQVKTAFMANKNTKLAGQPSWLRLCDEFVFVILQLNMKRVTWSRTGMTPGIQCCLWEAINFGYEDLKWMQDLSVGFCCLRIAAQRTRSRMKSWAWQKHPLVWCQQLVAKFLLHNFCTMFTLFAGTQLVSFSETGFGNTKFAAKSWGWTARDDCQIGFAS